ncbi:MAG: hypothetical protein DMG21_09535 [Acidobacteria bacterium]|nr:MAG: hypothetical protein DMG21_09535 [Acidobacteriota bacterium]
MKQNGSEKIGTEWLGLRQVTQYAAVSERTVREWIHASVDSLPAVRVGGKLLVRRSELDAWLGRHRVRPLDAVDLDGIGRDALQAVAHGRSGPQTRGPHLLVYSH